MLYPLMDRVLDKVISETPHSEEQNFLQKGVNFTMLQLKVIDSIKKGTDNKWIKKLLIHGFEKLSIDDIPFDDPDLNIREVVKTKVMGTINEVAAPSTKIYWYMIAYHWTVLLIILVTLIVCAI